MKILLPLDGSSSALHAVRHAIDLVRHGLRATFVLANVQEPAHLYEVMMSRDAAAIEAASDAAGEHALSDAAALLRDASVGYETEVVVGDPAPSLLDLIGRAECDAVIMSARGAGTLRVALLGSISQALLHASTVPITIVRVGDEGELASATEA